MPTSFRLDGLVPIADFNFLGKLTAMLSAKEIGRDSQSSSRGSLPSARFTVFRAEGASLLVRSISTLTCRLTGKVDIIPSLSLMTCLPLDEVLNRLDFDSDLQASLKKAAGTLSESWYSLAEDVLIGCGRSSPSTSGRSPARPGLVDLNVRS